MLKLSLIMTMSLVSSTILSMESNWQSLSDVLTEQIARQIAQQNQLKYQLPSILDLMNQAPTKYSSFIPKSDLLVAQPLLVEDFHVAVPDNIYQPICPWCQASVQKMRFITHKIECFANYSARQQAVINYIKSLEHQ